MKAGPKTLAVGPGDLLSSNIELEGMKRPRSQPAWPPDHGSGVLLGAEATSPSGDGLTETVRIQKIQPPSSLLL